MVGPASRQVRFALLYLCSSLQCPLGKEASNLHEPSFRLVLIEDLYSRLRKKPDLYLLDVLQLIRAFAHVLLLLCALRNRHDACQQWKADTGLSLASGSPPHFFFATGRGTVGDGTPIAVDSSCTLPK